MPVICRHRILSPPPIWARVSQPAKCGPDPPTEFFQRPLLVVPPPPTAIPPSLTVLLRDSPTCSVFLNSLVIQCYESEVHIMDRKDRVFNHDIEWAVHNLWGTLFLKPGMCSSTLVFPSPVVQGDSHSPGEGNDNHGTRLSRSDLVRLSRGVQSAQTKHWVNLASGGYMVVYKVAFKFLKMYYLVGWAAPANPSSPGHLGPLDFATHPHRPSAATTTFIATPSFSYLYDERHAIWPPATSNSLTLYTDKMAHLSKPVVTMGTPKANSTLTPSSTTSQLGAHQIHQYFPFHQALPPHAIRRSPSSHSNPSKPGNAEAWIHSQRGAGLYAPTWTMLDCAGMVAMRWAYWVTLEFEPDTTTLGKKRTESKTSPSFSSSATEPLLLPWQLSFTTMASVTVLVELLRPHNLQTDVRLETF
ncbi:hypothetical protein BJ085DRAFT_36725 [Dimargaris cristalligena]|uniref:Uncharacterized protein n=1 Tax=Dimargaris cristalligena TaxID=215637 RepID=A0A4P9ZYV0_9FUNG|nr:hypothetical protein BJ085DRAFT_36725 [Dimargaris cristalligena]|eukprot:RKP38558.1 hypothetical protein BJ085DRAFT_36725 [Dimargaris cristalligena]